MMVADVNHIRCSHQQLLVSTVEPAVPDSDAELLETLLARVMRLVSVHLDAPVSGVAGTALSAAEGSLLVELRAVGEVTQQQMADRLSVDKSRVSRARRSSARTCSPASATRATAVISGYASLNQGKGPPLACGRRGALTTTACSPR